jgi:DmsE family decaheme c-type cytochrome
MSPRPRPGRPVGVALLLLGLLAPAHGQEQDAAAPKFSAKGADTCLKCHDDAPVMAIFNTPHARGADARTPFAREHQCETCHGPAAAHAGRVKTGQERPPPPAFGPHATETVAQQNARCLTCHNDDHARFFWDDGAHAEAGLKCSSCHVLHQERDPVLAKATQAELCFGCHTREKNESLQPFSHPLRQGLMACSDCHEPHGQAGASLAAGPSINDTCVGCHAEKRGPFLWEHPPAAEDCTQCHRPHGSSQPAMLTQRPPLLCQNCHSQDGHPSVPFTAAGLPSGTPSAFLLVNSCANCHSQVHGSNHPSGNRLMR